MAYLDLDLSQTEFSIPGFVTLSIVEGAVLGPPFAHTVHGTHSRYLGSIAIDKIPALYSKAVDELFGIYKSVYQSQAYRSS